MTTNRLATSPSNERSPTDPCECAEWANARLTPEQAALFRYEVVNGKLIHRSLTLPLESKPKHVMDRRGQPMSEADTNKLNGILDNLGATARYRPDGTRYTVDKAA